MLVASCHSIIVNAYFAVFGLPTSDMMVSCDYVVESLYLFDIVFNFLEEYNEEETHLVVSNVPRIAWHYLTTGFVFDLIAWFPVEQTYSLLMLHAFGKPSGSSSFAGDEKLRLVRLLKLLRLQRMTQLLDAGRLREKLNSYYSKQLEYAAKDEESTFRYPVMRIMALVDGYHIFSLATTLLASAYIFAIFWLIFSIDIQSQWRS